MKNTRKLIPAIAMLLISAVMLSTASFAWFTMNEAVTATGMEIKAKASGNLLIGLSKMTAADQKISVTLENDKTEVVPVTYTDSKWQIPADATAVDPDYGFLPEDATFEEIVVTDATTLDYDASNYFIDYTVYVATAGDAEMMKNQTLYVSMDMISAAEYISNAYSIAFYVDKNDNGKISTDEYAGYVNYENFAKDTTGSYVFNLTGTFDIPSTYGANAENKQGLAIIMRVFVDGNLKCETVTPQVPNYVERTTGEVYGTDKGNLKFYKLENGEYVLQSTEQFTSTTSIAGYYTWDGSMKAGTVSYDKYYVNNSEIPTGSTVFDVTIGAKAAN